MMCGLNVQNESHQTMMKILSLLLVVSAAGCTKEQVRMNLVPQREAIAPRTIQIEASSSINGRPMADDPSLRSRVASAFQKQFPGAQVVQSDPDMVVFFTIVDYVPGCSPDCKKFKTYRNWTCEVEIALPQIPVLASALLGERTRVFFVPLCPAIRNPGF
jgi:hypothetical protein